MLPVMGHPAVVEESAGFFRWLFSWHQFRRFKQYLSGLITGRGPTVRNIASRLVEFVDQSNLNRFLTLYRWDGEEVNRRRLELHQSKRETRWRRDGVVAIDDTLLPKTGRKIPGAGRLWDHNSGCYVHAQSLVTSHHLDGERDYPIGFRRYFKHGSPEAGRYGVKTRMELAKELMDEGEELEVAAENYVLDPWCLSHELAGHIEAYGKGWVSRLKSNGVVYHGRRMSISQFERALPRGAFKEVRVSSASGRHSEKSLRAPILFLHQYKGTISRGC